MEIQAQVIDAAEVTRQTERIVASRVFAEARRSQRLLRYLVDAALSEQPQSVKEYTLAVDVLDRDASYDPAIEATVRVEAGRLRTRLREYCGEEGKENAILIELPKGAYSAVLTLRGELEERSEERDRTRLGSGAGVAVEERQWPSFEPRRRGCTTKQSGATCLSYRIPNRIRTQPGCSPRIARAAGADTGRRVRRR